MESLLELSKEKSNIHNREFQTFQSEIKQNIAQMSVETDMDKKLMYKDEINKLCNNYSLAINRLEIEYLNKCEQYLAKQNTKENTKENAKYIDLKQKLQIILECDKAQTQLSENGNGMNMDKNSNEMDLESEDEEDIRIIRDNLNEKHSGVIMLLSDDINLRYCPNCRAEAYRTDEDIKNRCSLMTCRKCDDGKGNWVYWCWDCSTIIAMERVQFTGKNEPAGACPQCRKLSRDRRNTHC